MVVEDIYSDLLVFIDEDDARKEMFVQILDTSNLVKFKTKGGNIISIPPSSVVKIKQKGSEYEQSE